MTGERWRLPASPEGRLEAVHWAYRIILLREPESRQALGHYVSTCGSASELRDSLLDSAESRSLGLPATLSLSTSLTGNEPPQPIQVHAEDEQRTALFERVQAVWRSLGDSRPHWSVMSWDKFLPEHIGQTVEEFYRTGEESVATLLRTLERNDIEPAALQRCMDFGCGLGRLSIALAPHFREVHAVDFSETHLRLASQALEERGASNVRLHRLRTIEDSGRLPKVDLFFSLIVLQHNPPPVTRELLGRLLDRVDEGGVAVFQVPTYLAGYRFVLDEYLAGAGRDMEMHAFPQREVFAVAREAGMEVLEVREDNWTGKGVGSQSLTFVLRRPRGGA